MKAATLNGAEVSRINLRQQIEDGGRVVAMDVTLTVSEPDEETITRLVELARRRIDAEIRLASE